VPHGGFEHLRRVCESKASHYVCTSNVDGQFEKSGFHRTRIFNAHGFVHFWQCTHMACTKGKEPWPAGDLTPGSLPKCKYCGRDARPNASFFDDNQGEYPESLNGRMIEAQFEGFEKWLKQLKNAQLCILEIGCGESEHSLRLIPKPRGKWACMSDEWGMAPIASSLVRIDPKVPVPGEEQGAIGADTELPNFAHIQTGAQEALRLLAEVLNCREGTPKAKQAAPPQRKKLVRRR